MRNLLIATALGGAVFALSGCEVEQTQEGELPEVDVEGGEMPAYDVETRDFDVTTEERTVEVPVIESEEPGEDETPTQ